MKMYPRGSLREKLFVAGIPATEHDVDALRGKLADLQPTLVQGLAPDALAELVLYFVAKGLITPAVSTDKALLDLPWGSHVCQFYENKEDQLRMLVPYFKQGLERNEACVWLVGDLTVDEAKTALAAAVPDLARHLASGQMTICHFTDLYTNPDGTVKDASQLSSDFSALGSTVEANGYAGLRASGGVSWVKDAESMTRFMDYETRVNMAIQNSRIMAVCTYPAKSAAMCQCRELIHNHGRIFVKRGEWVHDRSKDAQKIESMFAALAAS